ncbi:DUF1827 family protein [Lacticaseibacillus baoqingensis]|uniref:DUF1827 family protein n=1 Tax=Lacticaseibacillus baoqingensis TaxID=2486013 RepID=A0ABW4E7D5_9LACO|nr:DUF1827 family protein [Lacticaseibacillus baoqingensis]
MKLIENPIRLNASLHKMLPYTMRYLYGKHNGTVKMFRLYTLGSVHVHYVEGFTKTDVILTHEHRQIKQEEIDFVIGKLFPEAAKDQLRVDPEAKPEIEAAVRRKLPFKDMVIIELPTA